MRGSIKSIMPSHTVNGYDPVAEVLTRLKDAQQTADDQWLACCPAHEDRRPSLSIGRGNDGRALLNCHAGCKPAEVAYAVGMAVGDLFVDKRTPGSGPTIEATYDYRDEQGTLLRQVVRFE